MARQVLLYILTTLYTITLVAQNSTAVDSILAAYKVIDVNTEQLYEAVKETPATDITTLEIDRYTVYLYRSNILAPDYRAVDDQGNTIDNPGRAIPLKGHTRNGASVVATIGSNFLMMSIGSGNNEVWIERGSKIDQSLNDDQYITYRSADVIADPHAKCGVTQKANQKEKYDNTVERSMMMGTCYDVEYAIAHDFSMVTELDSVAGVEDFGIAITNEMNTLYSGQFTDILNFQITGQFVSSSTAADPWTTSTNAGTLLSSFRSWAPSNLLFPHDDATLWTNRDLDGSTIGVGYLGVICGSSRYNLCEHQSAIVTNRRLVSHEVGHNFSLNHVSGNFVMAGIVNNASDNWSAFNVTAIENYYNGLPSNCLNSPCVGSGTPAVGWITASAELFEISEPLNAGGSCGVPYKDYQVLLGRSTDSNDFSIAISTGPSTTASLSDFAILTPSLTFNNGGALFKAVTVRIFDDAIEEVNETIELTFSIVSGSANIGSITSHNITILESSDDISSICCSSGSVNVVGSGSQSIDYFFNGNNTGSRSRFFVPKNELDAAGVKPGYITQLDLNIISKQSTSPFQNFQLSIADYQGPQLPGSWLETTQVFSANYTTTLGWNSFPFSNPFFWDGLSGLYIEICYSNNGNGTDNLACFFSSGFNSSRATFVQGSICDGTVQGWSSTTRLPQTRFTGQGSGAKIETSTTTTYSSPITSGETIHIYSDDDEVIASLTNTSSTDIGCVDMSVHTSGNGKSTLTGGSDQYSDKTIKIDTDVDTGYEVTLYYKDTELSTWGGSAGSLSVLQSTVPLASATSSDVTTSSTTVAAFDGSDNGSAYTASFSGDGYFTISDKDPAPPASFDGNIFLGGAGNGLLMTSSSGTRYLIFESSPNNLTVTTAPAVLAAASMTGSDIFIDGSGGLFLTTSAGNAYSQYSVSNNETLTYASASIPGPPAVRLLSGNLEVVGAGKGLVMQSPNGTCYKITVSDNNGGSIEVTPVTCP